MGGWGYLQNPDEDLLAFSEKRGFGLVIPVLYCAFGSIYSSYPWFGWFGFGLF